VNDFFVSWQQVLTIGLFAAAVRLAMPVLLAALGEIVAERAGVLNLSTEGNMLVGAFLGFWAAQATGNLWVGVAVAGAAGALGGLAMAVLSTSLRSDQIVSGLALLIFGNGLSIFLYRVVYGTASLVPRVERFAVLPLGGLAELPIVGPILFQQNALTYLALLLVPITGIFLYKTPLGLRLRAVGENPRSVDTLGLSVVGLRYFAVIFGGLLAGVAGAYLTLGELGAYVENVTGGRGFIAIALVVFARWSPYRALGGALLFGLVDALQVRLQIVNAGIPPEFFVALPYIFTIATLLIVGRRGQGPAALTVAYQRGDQ
jgi:general nucleoside transport system permease protein